MVRIRMKRMGRPHRPFYRINAIDQRTKRDGIVIEQLGWYDPIASDAAKQVNLDAERIKHWLSVGAQPSDTVTDLLIKHNLMDGAARKTELTARAEARKKTAAAAPAKDGKKDAKKE